MSKKKDEELLNKYKQAKIDLEVIELENFHIKQDIIDLKRVVLSQAYEIERLRGLDRVNRHHEDLNRINRKYGDSFHISDDGMISDLDNDNENE